MTRRWILAALSLGCVLGSAQGPSTPIDRLTRLLHERLEIGREVAEAKFNSGAAVQDAKREAFVIESAAAEGSRIGLGSDVVRPFVRGQIEANKMVQRTFLSAWKGRAHFSPPPDLAALRPKINRIDHEILIALKKAEGPLRLDGSNETVRRAFIRFRFGGAAARYFGPAWNRVEGSMHAAIVFLNRGHL